MPRTVKCGLIQCTNAAPTDMPIEDIKRLNIEKHLGFIEQAAQQGPPLREGRAGQRRWELLVAAAQCR